MGNGQLIFFAGGVAVGYLGYHVIDTVVKAVLSVLGHIQHKPTPAPAPAPAPAPVVTPTPAPAPTAPASAA